jgi:hypothetical protein
MAKQCPECGQRVPFGGGRTVENAHLMYDLVRALGPRLKPGEEGAEARRFLEQGRRLADSLHEYGHKQSMVNPDWHAAGLWTKEARRIAEM